MASKIPKVFIISSVRVAPLDDLDDDVEAGGQGQEHESKWLLPANLFRHVVNVAYYMGAHPYKFAYNKTFYKVCNPFQQVVCAFQHILMIYGWFFYLVDDIPNKEKVMKRPSLYFNFALEISGFLFISLFIKGFWAETDKFLQILKSLQEDKDLPRVYILTKRPWIVPAFCLQFVAKLVYFCAIGYEVVTPISNLSPSTFFGRSVVIGRHLFLFQPKQNSSVLAHWNNITALDGVVGLLNGVYYSVVYSLYKIFKTVTLACALILWFECCSLKKNVEALENGEKIWLEIYQQFQAIQRLATAIYEALGNKIFYYMILYLAYFSTNLNILIVSENHVARLTNLLTFLNIIAFLYYSADIRNKVDTVYDWIQKDGNAEGVPEEHKRTVKHERNTQKIAIHAGKYFAITFGAIYAFVGLTITFFLICAADKWFEHV